MSTLNQIESGISFSPPPHKPQKPKGSRNPDEIPAVGTAAAILDEALPPQTNYEVTIGPDGFPVAKIKGNVPEDTQLTES